MQCTIKSVLTKMNSVRAAAVSRSMNCATAATTNPTGDASIKPVETSIRKKLEQQFQPKFLEVINESYMHSVPKGSETHFKVVVVSDRFLNQPLLNRHRLVNSVLEAELQGGVHALSINAKTPDQWENSDKTIEKSPPCRGGAGL